jgi:hypothetical protein
MDKKLLKVIGITSAAILIGGGLFIIGKKIGEDSLIKTLISLYEEGNNNLIVTAKNGLIYELAAQCIRN